MATSNRIGLRTGEALVEGELDYLCAEPEIVIGELAGPVGQALATLLGDQVKGHTRVFAILNSDVQVKPATLMVSKVTVSIGSWNINRKSSTTSTSWESTANSRDDDRATPASVSASEERWGKVPSPNTGG